MEHLPQTLAIYFNEALQLLTDFADVWVVLKCMCVCVNMLDTVCVFEIDNVKDMNIGINRLLFGNGNFQIFTSTLP